MRRREPVERGDQGDLDRAVVVVGELVHGLEVLERHLGQVREHGLKRLGVGRRDALFSPSSVRSSASPVGLASLVMVMPNTTTPSAAPSATSASAPSESRGARHIWPCPCAAVDLVHRLQLDARRRSTPRSAESSRCRPWSSATRVGHHRAAREQALRALAQVVRFRPGARHDAVCVLGVLLRARDRQQMKDATQISVSTH